MENIIFYAPYVVCILLLFVIASNYTKINKYKSNAQFWYESFNDVSKRLQDYTKGFDQIELLKTAIEVKEDMIQDQSKALQKQSDEITILKQQVDSLTNHLKERAKPFDPLAALDELIPTKMETKKKFKKQ